MRLLLSIAATSLCLLGQTAANPPLRQDPVVQGIAYAVQCSDKDPVWEQPSVRYQFRHVYGKPVTVVWQVESTDVPLIAKAGHATAEGVQAKDDHTLIVTSSILVKSSSVIYAESVVLEDPCNTASLKAKILKVTYQGSTEVPPEAMIGTQPAPPPETKPVEVKPRFIRLKDAQTITAGMKRSEVVKKLGEPAGRVSMSDDGQMLESFRYPVNDSDWVVIKLVNGVVTLITLPEPQ